jgi:hypothetical protein
MSHRDFWEFCNTICQEETSLPAINILISAIEANLPSKFDEDAKQDGRPSRAAFGAQFIVRRTKLWNEENLPDPFALSLPLIRPKAAVKRI